MAASTARSRVAIIADPLLATRAMESHAHRHCASRPLARLSAACLTIGVCPPLTRLMTAECACYRAPGIFA
ncbi:hypothetical protein Dimus_018241, partial [Dionaea muscipula]